ncbi:MAG: hypothetical protein QXP71_02310 [Desulfurococcaceae archaeon]
MDIDTFRNLFKALDFIAKKLFKVTGLPIEYSLLSVLIIIPLIIGLINLINYPLIYLLTVLSGFIGSTVMTMYLTNAKYLLDKHIQLSKYYYMSIRDMLNIVKDRGEIREFVKALEELLIISRSSIEYTPVSLIPAYSALLFMNDRIYLTIFFLAYMAISTAMFYETISKFNTHVSYENMIEKEIFNLIDSNNRKEYSFLKYNVFLSIITFSLYITYKFIKINNELHNHVNLHRSNYQELAKYFTKYLKQ